MGTQDCSHFDQVRMQNRRIIRNLMRQAAQITKAELAEESGLSFPTVSALIGDLLASGEVIRLPESATRGGRPAELFALSPVFQTAVCAYIEDHNLYIRVYDVFGQVLHDARSLLTSGHSSPLLLENLLRIREQFPSLSVLCLGIPGVIENGRLTYLPDYPDMQDLPLQQMLETALSVPVHLENDVNVFVSAERDQWPDLVHIFLGANGPGAGILVRGQLIRGVCGYAGELEFLPFEHLGVPVTFCEKLRRIKADMAGSDGRTLFLQCLARAIVSIICIINPPDVALSGFGLAGSDIADLQGELERIIPAARCPALHIVDQVDDLYQSGLLKIAMDDWKER